VLPSSSFIFTVPPLLSLTACRESI
jgi:hypothetical protein